MIPHYHDRIKDKGLRITGIDISADALARCARRITTYGLEDRIVLHRTSIEAFQPSPGQCFDFIFFSQTFMLMDDQSTVLRRVRQFLAPQGQIVFFQTMHTRRNWILDLFKPRLKFFLGIDFGRVT